MPAPRVTPHGHLLQLALLGPRTRCKNGDVRTVTIDDARTPTLAHTKTTPEFFYSGEWHPICGHYFWDNENGAATLCRKLGFDAGKLVAKGLQFSQDAIPVGKCEANQALTSCKLGDYKRQPVPEPCARGKPAGVAMQCSGGSKQRTASCITGVYRNSAV